MKGTTGHAYKAAFKSTFSSWICMIRRCSDPTINDYKHYGGRGIRVCNRWFNFRSFLEDMGPRPAGKILDRKRNERNYSPSNCRWVTPKQSARNRTNNHFVRYGSRKITIGELASRLGVQWEVMAAWLKWKNFKGDASLIQRGFWKNRRVFIHPSYRVGKRT